MSKYLVTVTALIVSPDPKDPATTTEVFRQAFEEGEFNLCQFVRQLNEKPRGRPAKKPAKEASAP